jgi:tetratricopeptide (TPR) repeat protein
MRRRRHDTILRALLAFTIGLVPVSVIGSLARVHAADAERIDDWLRDLGDPDPFISRRGAAEIRQLGDEALVPLAARWKRWVEPEFELEALQQLRVEALLDELLVDYLSQLESEYRGLELDRRELAQLESQAAALRELEELRAKLVDWEKATIGFRTKAEIFLEWQALESRRKLQGKLPESDVTRLRGLEKQVTGLREVVPSFDEKAKSYARLLELESIASSLESVRNAAELRRKDLETRSKETQPRVESLTDQLHSIGLPAYAAIAARREFLPLSERPEGPSPRSMVRRFFDKLLSGAVDRLAKTGELVPSASHIEKARHQLATLWAVEIDRKGEHAARAKTLLDSHVKQLVAELDHADPRMRDRAAGALFRLERRGIDAVDATEHSFVAGLLRWRIDPRVYERVGIHFSDFAKMPFSARRRKVIQYARAAGPMALPTLRAIVENDDLEKSFLVKYAAARALASQLGDRQGIVTLQARHPEMVLKRPEVSRDLYLIQGLAFVQSKDYADAVREFLKILEEFPFDFQGNYHLAFSYLLLKDYPRAIHHFEIASRILPRDQLTLYNLACAYSLGGRTTEALDALANSVEAGFDDPDHLEKDSDLDPIRKEPRYRTILEKCAGKAEEKSGS